MAIVCPHKLQHRRITIAQYLSQAGILHDGDYAAAFARTAAYSKAWAPSRIRVELRRRGVVRTDIEAALAAALGSGPTADHDCIGTCMALLVERVDAAVEGGEDVQAVLDAAAVDETADGAMRSAGALLVMTTCLA